MANKFEVIVALADEVQGLLKSEDVSVTFCGIGKVNASLAAAEAILKKGATHIINLGTAGSHYFPTHSTIEISGFVQRDMDLTPLGFPLGETPFDEIKSFIETESFFTELPRGICGTGDKFETAKPVLDYHLVDMEAYAIAKVCKKYGVPFTSIKYITDGSDENANKDWQENLPRAAKSLFEAYKQITQRV